MKQPSVREINSHTFAGQHVCVVYRRDGTQFRISRSRTIKGTKQGRVICGNVHSLQDWEVIPDDAIVELQ